MSKSSVFAKSYGWILQAYVVLLRAWRPPSLKATADSLRQGSLACQPKPWRRLVEATGVEPASEKVYYEKTTCVSDSVVLVRLVRNRPEGGGLA